MAAARVCGGSGGSASASGAEREQWTCRREVKGGGGVGGGDAAGAATPSAAGAPDRAAPPAATATADGAPPYDAPLERVDDGISEDAGAREKEEEGGQRAALISGTMLRAAAFEKDASVAPPAIALPPPGRAETGG